MSKKTIDVEEVVADIFREIAGVRALRLAGDFVNAETSRALSNALKKRYPEKSRDIAFHLTDWNSDAAFIVAMHLYPERFTTEQIEEGVERFLVHAPNHVAAAAKLGEWPVTDIFGVDL